MTIQEAIKKRIERVRLPAWAPNAYLRFRFTEDGHAGPWAYLTSPDEAVTNQPLPLWTMMNDAGFEPAVPGER